MIQIKKLGEGVWWKNGIFWIILSPFIAMDLIPVILWYFGYLKLNPNHTMKDYYEFGLEVTIVVGGGLFLLLLIKKLKSRRIQKNA